MMKRQSKWPWKGPKQPIVKSPFTGMNRDSSVSHLLEQDIPSSISLRRTCDQLSIASFKKAYCRNDLSVLIISGNPAQQELQDAFNEIIFEYSGLIKTDHSQAMHEMMVQIGLLQAHVIYVGNALQLLRLQFSLGNPIPVDVVHELVELGYQGVYDDKDEQGYLQQLNRVESLCKTKVFDLEATVDELNRLQKTVEGKKQSEEDIDKNVVMLSKYMGYRIDQSVTMLDEYAQIMNIYITELNHQKKRENA